MNLRPSKLADFIGQEHIKRLLSISIQAAKSRGDALNHVLLSGPAGIGKTTLAFIIAQEMGAKCQVINGATIQEMSALEEIFRNLAPFDVVFIDEIHRLPRQLEEFLYHPMEDRIMTERVEVLAPSEMAAYIDLTDEIAPELLMFYPGYKEKRWEKTGKYTMKEVKLPSFTLVGATTQPGDLSKPLRDRFQLSLPRLRYYSVDELITIARQKARMLNLTITDEASRMLAKCSRGVPRICVNFILRCRDLVDVNKLDGVTKDVVNYVFRLLLIDHKGLNNEDREYLEVLADEKPKGAMALSYALSVDKNTIENVIEPYLLQLHFIERTSRGRVITSKGLKHIGGC